MRKARVFKMHAFFTPGTEWVALTPSRIGDMLVPTWHPSQQAALTCAHRSMRRMNHELNYLSNRRTFSLEPRSQTLED